MNYRRSRLCLKVFIMWWSECCKDLEYLGDCFWFFEVTRKGWCEILGERCVCWMLRDVRQEVFLLYVE